jgi:hypothetical protein
MRHKGGYVKQHKDRSIKFGLLVGLVLLLAGVSVALLQIQQSPTADIDANFGTVRVLVSDEVGVPLSNATVMVTSDQTNQVTTLSDKDDTGHYTANVRSGTYTINAESLGYKGDSQPISIQKGDSQELSFYLAK